MGTNLPPIFLHVSPVCVTRAGAHEGVRDEHVRYGRHPPRESGVPSNCRAVMNLRRHAPRKRGIQYYSRHIGPMGVRDDWINRWSLHSDGAKRRSGCG